jgi:group I intron endonuclease
MGKGRLNNDVWTIYRITNLVSQKMYVGQTAKPAEQRWKEHCSLAESHSKQKKKLHKAIQKYGVKNFLIETLDTAQTLSEANEKERLWISKLNSIECGYNLTLGGDGGFWLGQKHSQKTKDRIGAWSRGKPKSVDHRLKISRSNIGKKSSQANIRSFCHQNASTLYSTLRRNVPTREGWMAARV